MILLKITQFYLVGNHKVNWHAITIPTLLTFHNLIKLDQKDGLETQSISDLILSLSLLLFCIIEFINPPTYLWIEVPYATQSRKVPTSSPSPTTSFCGIPDLWMLVKYCQPTHYR